MAENIMFGLTMVCLLAIIVFNYFSFNDPGYDDAMQEAFDRGYAVQCVGKTGIYWECEE